MNQRFPVLDESAESVEGTAAHWVGWEMFANRPMGVGIKAPNGVIVTDEMIEGGELLADTIEAEGECALWFIEKQIPITSISPHCFGTPDYWALFKTRNRIAIVDYKFGHRFVDEFWNPQGLCYLSGILDLIRREQHFPIDLDLVVSFTVVQPRCFYKGEAVRTHTFTLAQAIEHLERLSEAAAATLVPDPTATTNDHCIDCPGRHACSALQLAAYDAAEISNHRSPLELSPEAAGLELRLLERAMKRLEARVDGLREQTIANLRAGKQIPYYRTEPGFGRQQWAIPDTQIIGIGQLFGQDLSKPGTLTPKQAEKLGVSPEIVKQFSFTPSTGFKLVPVTSADAARTFGRVVVFQPKN